MSNDPRQPGRGRTGEEGAEAQAKTRPGGETLQSPAAKIEFFSRVSNPTLPSLGALPDREGFNEPRARGGPARGEGGVARGEPRGYASPGPSERPGVGRPSRARGERLAAGRPGPGALDTRGRRGRRGSGAPAPGWGVSPRLGRDRPRGRFVKPDTMSRKVTVAPSKRRRPSRGAGQRRARPWPQRARPRKQSLRSTHRSRLPPATLTPDSAPSRGAPPATWRVGDMSEALMRGNGAVGEGVEKTVREEVWRRAALSLYATRTEDKRRSRGKKKKGEIHYRGLHDAVTEVDWDFTRFAAHALTVVPDDVYPRFYRFIDIDARKYLLLNSDERPREGSAVTELKGRLQAIVDAGADGLRAEKHGRVWHVYIPRENWYVVVSKPTNGWSVHVPLKGYWVESEFPEVLVRTPPDVLRSLQKGWVLTDVTPPRGRFSDVSFATTQPWQLPSTLASFPSDDIKLGVTAGILGSTRLSIQWHARVYGYEEALSWASRLIGEVKRAEFRRLVEECKALNGDPVALFTGFLGDGGLEYFLRLRWLYFKVGHELLYLPAESAIVNARLAVERASEYVRFVSLVTKCPKVKHFLYVGYGMLQKRGRKNGQRNNTFYAEVAGARLHLVYISTKNHVYARIAVEAVPQGWVEEARAQGWDVRVVNMGGREYYQVTHSSLFEHARSDTELRATLLAFAKHKAEQYPKAQSLVERLEKLGTED
ncbi:hypothetical protein Tpen_0646 [Thermofilum pendens Hrk 5]|uniref:Uncharacterized protein n=2 Tax=Thermofilum pendens TaxID=2269 RepID=A1RXW8_THEPD|nr:hypothetical protein Tpen_0646 [Thermofilum pendens Hrk 5]